MNYPSPEFEAALAALCAGTAEEKQRCDLAETLRTNAAARDAYLFAVELHARLASDNVLFLPSASDSEEEAPELSKVVPLSRKIVPFWLKVAAAGLLAGTAVLVYFASPRNEESVVFARFVRSAGAEFASGVKAGDGEPLRGEALSLTQGSVELATARGATVVLEAPAEFRFESAQRLHLARGKAAAEVPPSAKGFTILTPSGEVIDLGTKFGVDVPKSGASEVHVFKGEVLARADGETQKRSVKGDQALALSGGTSAPRELRSAAFIHAPELQQLAAGWQAGRPAQGAQAVAALRRDPAWLAALDFEAIQGGEFRWAQGRWPGSRAVEFTQPGDFIPVEFSGTTNELTLAVWVRLDRVPRAINSLLHTNGWGQPGQVHWMVAENQRMRFALYDVRCVDQSRNRYPESNSLVTAATGRWTHLAAVYDASRRVVRFYIDGKFDNEVALLTGIPAVLGPARVGNWNRQERILSGRLDELVLLKRALTDAEIRALFEAGSPYQ
jgi:hypothetical protein